MPFWGNIISHKFLAKHTQSQQNSKYNDWTFTEKQLDSKINIKYFKLSERRNYLSA